MPKVVANGITIAYEQDGAGPDLVLVTGIGYGGWFWRRVVPGLARHFRVTVFDNRGAGESDRPDGPYTVDMMAADTAGLLDALGIRRAAVLGHSLGGYIVQRLVATRPELAGRLILASTNHGGLAVIPTTPQAIAVMTNRQGDPLEIIRRGIGIATAPGFAERDPAVVQELIAYRLGNPVPPAQYTAQVMAGMGTAQWSSAQVEQQMRAIQVPTLILFGENDNVVPAGNAGLMAAKIANARVTILPNAGHLFPIEDPAATVMAIVAFLKDFGGD
ncbi:MAG: alpha/beta hydrolase [Chloroflexi bacterium]|nr:alpha/beta hydrolase [Chloroflexota bacterium]